MNKCACTNKKPEERYYCETHMINTFFVGAIVGVISFGLLALLWLFIEKLFK